MSSILQIDLNLNPVDLSRNQPMLFFENLLGYGPHLFLLFQACGYGFGWILLDQNPRFRLMSRLLGCCRMLELKLASKINHAPFIKKKMKLIRCNCKDEPISHSYRYMSKYICGTYIHVIYIKTVNCLDDYEHRHRLLFVLLRTSLSQE